MTNNLTAQLARIQKEISDTTIELQEAFIDYNNRRTAAQNKLSKANAELTMLVAMLPEKGGK